MAMQELTPATRPTIYFIGVTTSKSSIMKVFPAWAQHLGLADAVIKGIDFPLHAPAGDYRQAVEFIKHDPLAAGALVTTHKIDLYKACQDLFEVIDPHACFMGETSCISKAQGSLVCHAKDPISSGLALDGFLPQRHFAATGGEVFSMGAGGSTIALTWHLMQPSRGANRPSRIIVSDCNPARLEDIRRIHAEMASGIPCDYVLVRDESGNDAVMAELEPRSLVINATGLGKDAPGSPLSDSAEFPEHAIVWDLNYRGDLVFLQQAKRQRTKRHLQIEDGWTYFLHGWTQVIGEVFHVAIPTSGPSFASLSDIAQNNGKS